MGKYSGKVIAIENDYLVIEEQYVNAEDKLVPPRRSRSRYGVRTRRKDKHMNFFHRCSGVFIGILILALWSGGCSGTRPGGHRCQWDSRGLRAGYDYRHYRRNAGREGPY